MSFFLLLCHSVQVVVIVNENTLVVLVVEDPIDHMTDKKFELELASDVNVLCDIFVGLGEYMADHQPVGLLKL